MALAVATKLRAGQRTSSPALSPEASQARWRAAVPLATATACLMPQNWAKPRSNSSVLGPMESHPDLSTWATASISSEPKTTSARGTCQQDSVSDIVNLRFVAGEVGLDIADSPGQAVF